MAGIGADKDVQRAADEAVEWVILLREEPDDAELRLRFEAWLASSPVHARVWSVTSHAYDRAGDARPSFAKAVRPAENRPVLPPGVAVLRRRRDAKHRWRGERPIRRILAAGAVAAGLAILMGPSLFLRMQADYRTGTAEQAEAMLADGSRVRLAPDSAIAVTYAANRREIRLLRGEAWFDVRHDGVRPFYVEANGVTTTDIGTTFDVRIASKGVATEVATGRVRVAYDAAPPVSEVLMAGDILHVARDGTTSRGRMPAGQVAAWRNRQIIVQDRPASEVIDALRPWFGGIILVQGDSFAHEHVTGVYNAADPVEALRALTQAYGGSVRRVTPWMVVLSG